MSPLLQQVLYHRLASLSRPHDVDNMGVKLELEALTSAACYLCLMLLEYYGKHLAQPRRDLFEKAATSLLVTLSDQYAGSVLQ